MILHKGLESNQPCYFAELIGNKQGILTTHFTKKSKWLKPYVETLCKVWYFNKHWMFGLDREQLEITRGHIFREVFTSAKEVSGEIGCSEAYTTLLQTNIAGWIIPPFWFLFTRISMEIFMGELLLLVSGQGLKNAGNLSEVSSGLPSKNPLPCFQGIKG